MEEPLHKQLITRRLFCKTSHADNKNRRKFWVHLVSSDFNHFLINVVFFRAQINVICKKINGRTFDVCDMQNIVCNTFFLLYEVKYIFFWNYLYFRGYKRRAFGSNVLNTTSFMSIRKIECCKIKVKIDPCLVVLSNITNYFVNYVTYH